MNKLKERDKITNEVALASAYQKDIANYYEIGCAEGFINCMKYMDKDKIEEMIEGITEQYEEEKDNKQLEYILRIYKDEFKKES